MPDKGKDERGVGNVKRNAIAGRSFASWAALEAHLAAWARDGADVRIHSTTDEAPAVRFERGEAVALRPLAGRPPVRQMRELTRHVQNDGCVDVDINHYSVPWRLIGATVGVVVSGGAMQVLHAGAEVGRHAERRGRRERAVDAAHLHGIILAISRARQDAASVPLVPGAELLHPLSERVNPGTPRLMNKPDSTSAEPSLRATRMHSASRVNSSTSGKPLGSTASSIRSLRPSRVRSSTIS